MTDKQMTVKENLDRARRKAHVTMMNNGHFVKMAKASIKAKKLKKKNVKRD